MNAWKPGDRVRVQPSAGSGNWYSGTVREVDPPDLRPGVIVDLDELVRGTRVCYATHTELRREEKDS